MLISAETESFSSTWVAAESHKPRTTFAITANTLEEYESLWRGCAGPSAHKMHLTRAVNLFIRLLLLMLTFPLMMWEM